MIKIKGLKKDYPHKTLFNYLTLTIGQGKLVGITGKSGSGKSTFLNIIGLLEREYTGHIELNGIEIASLSRKQRSCFIRENINYLFQNYGLIDDESVEYNLLLALEYTALNKKEKAETINEALRKFDLLGTLKQPVYLLSGGEQQRIALIRTSLKPGMLILADEPTGNLDKENSAAVFTFLQELAHSGKTVMIVTHDLELAKSCDECLEL